MMSLGRNWITLSSVLAALFLGACLKKPSSEVASLDYPLTIKGKVEDSGGLAAAGVGIYIESEPTPEIRSNSDGTFIITIDGARMSSLRFKYAPMQQPLRLYFVKDGTPGEAASYNQLQTISIGELDIGVLRLSPQVTISGVVKAAKRLEQNPLPVSGAFVQIGRNAALTDAAGRFAVYAPARNALPILISQPGYVQTQGTWFVGSKGDVREFLLYDRLSVDGQLAIPSTYLSQDPNMKVLTLALSANILARWVRVALQEEELLDPNSSRATWQLVESPVQIPISAATPDAIYYQFTDKDKQVLSGINRLDLNLSAFPPYTAEAGQNPTQDPAQGNPADVVQTP